MKIKKIISVVLVAALIASVAVMGTISSSASGTGTGLAEWALNAYYSNWSYVYGGSEPGAVDCSGLIYSYAGGYRCGDDQTFNASYRGYLSDGIPNIHGLGLYKPGHVGVYVGGGMAVDARGSDYGVCYESVYSHGWTQYFKVPGVSYPTTGWVEFSGNSYYYENGEYLADTSREIGGETYYFDSNGISNSTPSDTSATASNSSQSSSSESRDNDDNSSTGSLRLGSHGERVEALQERLAELGYYNGPIDGDFGTGTEAAFKLFQRAMGLTEDGIAGSDADLLFSEDAPYYQAETKIEKHNSDEELAESAAEEPAEEPEEELATTFKMGDYTNDLVPVQERLIELSYLPEGEADGSFGEKTAQAVNLFQDVNEIEKTGEIDENTYEVLFSDDAIENPNPVEAATEAPTEAVTEVPTTAAALLAPTSAPNTEAQVKASQLSNKALIGVTDTTQAARGASSANFEFILWLAIMIVVMLITFAIVYAVEKRKNRGYVGTRYQ